MESAFWKRYQAHFRETLTLSLPVVIGQVGHVLMGVIDSMMIGRLGYEYLSASTLGNSMFFLVTVVGIGITMAISPLVAEANAAGEYSKCGDYLRQGLYTSLVVSIISVIIIFLLAYVLPYLDQPERDVELAFSFQQIIAFSFLPMMIFSLYKQFADGLSLTYVGMIVTLAGLLFNVGANWVLIYGKLGFPRLELDGAGYGTLLSRCFMMGLIVVIVHSYKAFKRYELEKHWRELKGIIIRKILQIGLPSGLQYFFEVGAFVGSSIMLGWLGSEARSAHQIAMSMSALTYMVAFGLSSGASIRVGNALGRRDITGVRDSGYAGIIISSAFMSLMGIVFILFNSLIPYLYVDEQAVIEIASGLLIIAAFFQIFDGIQAVSLGALRGIQDVRMPTYITFFAYWVVCLGIGYILTFPLKLGVYGTWYAFSLGLMTSAALLTYRFHQLTKSSLEELESLR